jgi:hypothetical protein
MLAAVLWVHAIVLQAPQKSALKRFEVIRVNPDGMRRLPESMRSIFVDPIHLASPLTIWRTPRSELVSLHGCSAEQRPYTYL